MTFLKVHKCIVALCGTFQLRVHFISQPSPSIIAHPRISEDGDGVEAYYREWVRKHLDFLAAVNAECSWRRQDIAWLMNSMTSHKHSMPRL